MSETKSIPRTLTGTVVSAKMENSISVSIDRLVRHPVYDKYIRRSTKLLAHDENNECNEGDIVIIESTRPISKRKSWRLQKIVTRAQ
ncbi:MAG: 30S ribosomal protein S17 [Gammaproteobacteria bacterium]|nr:30S ribosomal protein S17 [Gammaproteobacteria bacterium]